MLFSLHFKPHISSFAFSFLLPSIIIYVGNRTSSAFLACIWTPPQTHTHTLSPWLTSPAVPLTAQDLTGQDLPDTLFKFVVLTSEVVSGLGFWWGTCWGRFFEEGCTLVFYFKNVFCFQEKLLVLFITNHSFLILCLFPSFCPLTDSICGCSLGWAAEHPWQTHPI